MGGLRVLVTGASGFIGSQLAHALCQRGYRVRVLHRPSSSLEALQGLDVERVQGDLTQPASLPPALKDVEIVFHAAARLRGGDYRLHQAVTVEGTARLAQAAREAGVRRFIHTSSVAALGVPAPRQKTPFSETHTWSSPPSLYPYGYAKYQAELALQKQIAMGLDAVILNPTMVFGAGDVQRKNSSLLVSLARRRFPACVEGGTNVVHIADVVAGHLAALKYGQTGQRYILAGENLTFKELFILAGRISGQPVPTWEVPGWLLRGFSPPARMINQILKVPVPLDLLQLAGRYFYADNRHSLCCLHLEAPQTAESAIRAGWEWFHAQNSMEGMK